MKKFVMILGICSLLGCDQPVEKTRGIPAEAKVRTEAPARTVEETEKALKAKGYETSRHKTGDSTILMQQYYLVLLKAGENRRQDSARVAALQKEHLAHLSRMAEEGFISLAGPIGDEGPIRGIVIYNTPTLREADSLANLDPMVREGRLEVEVHPWWVAKGGKLQ